DTLTLDRPDDWHLHLRDGDRLADTVAASSRVFGRAIVMPNLRPAVATVDAAVAYREQIMAARPSGSRFEPLMTLYLTPGTPVDEIRRAIAHRDVHAVKLYPAGATTNADAGVTDLAACADVFEAMAEGGLPLLVHGESIAPADDVFDRESIFVRDTLAPLVERFPTLRVVLEHITTEDAVRFVESASGHVAATITAHHLLYDRNEIFRGGVRPHMYCLPVLKRARHREALVAAATGGNPKFFLGTDSAPHAKRDKESACGCAGVYTAHAAVEFYAEAFDEAGALDRLEGFASHHGPDFYGLPRNTDRIRLRRIPQRVPHVLPLGDTHLVPLRAGESVGWVVEPD
ncbi:MAG: dihydroorotase, partial [Nannocystaceae bacterium]|nr:dihydroorotase [Nannocystaceae bacterium]